MLDSQARSEHIMAGSLHILEFQQLVSPNIRNYRKGLKKSRNENAEKQFSEIYDYILLKVRLYSGKM